MTAWSVWPAASTVVPLVCVGSVLVVPVEMVVPVEVEPPQVNQYCRTIIRWPDWIIDVIARVKPPEPVILGPDASTVPLVGTDKALGERLVTLAKDPSVSLVMRFADVMAEREPGASWEVYVGQRGRMKTDPESPNFVGTVALFGDGIKGEGHHAAEFSFALDRALGEVSDPSQLVVVFVPSSGVVLDGRPVPPKVAAPVAIGDISLQAERPRK